MGMITALKQLLKSLCYGSKWKYAVLWKLNQAQLTWEDGYIDNEESGGFLSGKSGIISFGCEVDNQSGNPANCLIELAVANMSCRSYRLGEGLAGKVASSRKHHWIFAEEVNSRLQEEFHEEWKQQSEAGIKTVLLVPVIPLGVVQLGSLDKVLEDVREVVRIRDHFSAIQNATGACISPLPRMSQPKYFTPSTSTFMFQDDPLHVVNMNTSIYADEATWDSRFSNLFADQIGETPLDLSMFTSNTTVGDVPTFSFLEGELDGVSVNHGFISSQPAISTPYMKGLEHETGEVMNSTADHHPFSTFPSFYDDCTWDSILSNTDEWNYSAALGQLEPPEVHSSTNDAETEQLLDSLIAELLMTSDDKQSTQSKCTGLCSNSPCTCSESRSPHKGSVSRSYKRFVLDREGSISSPTRSSAKSTISASPNSEQQDLACGPHKGAPKLATHKSRKRGHASDVHKLKPRDRQLIQERIKELRELVPNGSKCSIDALLYQTIKHMMFLQSIPHHVEKLKHPANSKVKIEDKDSSGAQVFKKGTSWVYELGRQQQQQCPLIVENLDQPGQILIEMQCEEYGFFLEIAQVIRRLKLIILKGVLETRSDKLWAHFIVETPKGFHRMDILWPLVQLLQRSDVLVF